MRGESADAGAGAGACVLVEMFQERASELERTAERERGRGRLNGTLIYRRLCAQYPALSLSLSLSLARSLALLSWPDRVGGCGRPGRSTADEACAPPQKRVHYDRSWHRPGGAPAPRARQWYVGPTCMLTPRPLPIHGPRPRSHPRPLSLPSRLPPYVARLRWAVPHGGGARPGARRGRGPAADGAGDHGHHGTQLARGPAPGALRGGQADRRPRRCVARCPRSLDAAHRLCRELIGVARALRSACGAARAPPQQRGRRCPAGGTCTCSWSPRRPRARARTGLRTLPRARPTLTTRSGSRQRSVGSWKAATSRPRCSWTRPCSARAMRPAFRACMRGRQKPRRRSSQPTCSRWTVCDGPARSMHRAAFQVTPRPVPQPRPCTRHAS